MPEKLKDTYIDPFTDFGFKKLFGEECNKERIFAAAEIAKLTPEEYRAYVDNLNSYRDLKNSLDYAETKGRAEGRAEGERERFALQQRIAELEKQIKKQNREPSLPH